MTETAQTQHQQKLQEWSKNMMTKQSMTRQLYGMDALDQTFLAGQGMYIPMTTIYQDYKSTILLAENGRTTSSTITRHLNIRYLFVTDKIKKCKVKVAFCPMHNMLGNFFTKLLQGTVFAQLQEKIS